MALDFPSSPTVGQQYLNWTWNGVAWVVTPGPPLASLAQSAQNAGRNYLDNALFNVQQRGQGPFTTQQYTADRWLLGFNLDTNSISLVGLTDVQRVQIGDESAVYGLQNVFTGNAGAASYSVLIERIEKVRRLSGKTVTLSFFAVASAAGMQLGVNAIQIFGSGGSPSAAVPIAGQIVTLASTFARYQLTFNIPSTAGKTFGTNGDDCTQVQFGYSSGSTNSAELGGLGVQSGIVTLWGMQVEVGSQATPLEKLVPEVDLARCQRFYQAPVMVWALYQAAGAIFQVSMPISPTMRATPTATLVPGNTISNLSGFSLSALPNLLWTNGTVQTTGGVTITSNVTLSADL